MNKVNFLEIFSYDTATENNCKEAVLIYKKISQAAFKQAGESLLKIAQHNPTTIELDWSFTPRKNSDSCNK